MNSKRSLVAAAAVAVAALTTSAGTASAATSAPRIQGVEQLRAAVQSAATVELASLSSDPIPGTIPTGIIAPDPVPGSEIA